MKIATRPTEIIPPEAYIEGERISEVRHEYVNGRVYAMAGASDDHNRIAGNIFLELGNALRGHRCESFINDMKVKIPPAFADVFYYPDVMVVGDPSDNAKYYREHPTILFEVLSPETERTDTREKAIAYRAISTLLTYVIVEQDRMALTVQRRTESGWQSELLEQRDAVLRLPEIGVEIALERLYLRTDLLRQSQSCT